MNATMPHLTVCPYCGSVNEIVNQCGCDQNNLPTCLHNVMIRRNDAKFSWECEKCGYVYGDLT